MICRAAEGTGRTLMPLPCLYAFSWKSNLKTPCFVFARNTQLRSVLPISRTACTKRFKEMFSPAGLLVFRASSSNGSDLPMFGVIQSSDGGYLFFRDHRSSTLMKWIHNAANSPAEMTNDQSQSGYRLPNELQPARSNWLTVLFTRRLHSRRGYLCVGTMLRHAFCLEHSSDCRSAQSVSPLAVSMIQPPF